MELLFEIIFELIVEGSLEISSARKVPLLLRIVAGLILIGVYGGIAGFLLYEGFVSRNWVLAAGGIAILLFGIVGFWKTYKKHHR